MSAKRIPIEERLTNHSDRSGGPDACWNWTGCLRHAGSKRGEYGAINVDGKQRVASRIAYEHYCGPIPEGMFVCHHCDNRRCINPKHLFLGTPLDNMKDRDKKGRHARCAPHHICRGEKNHKSKLTAQQVIEIRRLHEQGVMNVDIAKQFGIGKTNVGDIVRRRIWKHV